MRHGIAVLAVLLTASGLYGQVQGLPDRPGDGDKPVERWVDATGRAAGTDEKAKDEAVAQALRAAVQEACGVFLTAQTRTRDYQAVYDKVIANAVGYVREYRTLSINTVEGVTVAKIRALVSTRRFEEDWASIAHTVQQENNPRVIVAIVESTFHGTAGPAFDVKESGVVQGKVEDFFLSKGITLMDRATAASVAKRDVLLAAIKDDVDEMAALGARFSADVVVSGQATAKFGKELDIAGHRLYQFTATLNVRVVQTDSARVLVSRSYGPTTVNVLQRGGGEDKALEKLGSECASDLLAAVVEAWRKRAAVSRTVQLNVSGMDFDAWRTFRSEAETIPGVQAVRLREITESLANIDVEYSYNNETLAERLSELKTMKLAVLEITANRVKVRIVKADAPEPH